MSDPSAPKPRTTAAWARAFGHVLLNLNQHYIRNTQYGGRLIEYVRPLDCGLFVSQNCIAVKGTYYHCFALLFTATRLGPGLYHPFAAGSRFDHNRTIESQMFAEFGHEASRGIHSAHGWRARAEELVLDACATAEAKLLPRYLERLADHRKALEQFLEAGLAFARRDERERAQGRTTLNRDLVRRVGNVTALNVPCVDASAPDSTIALEEALILHGADLKRLAPEIPRMLEIVRAL